MKAITKLFSFLFHPVFMPLLGYVILYNSGIYESGLPWEVKKYSYLINTLFSIFLPVSMLSFLLYFHQIRSIELNDRKERSLPLLFTTISLLLLFIVTRKYLPLKVLQGFTLSTVVVSFLLLLITLRVKISMHMVGLGGISGLIIAISLLYQSNLFAPLAITIIVAGVVGSARLWLQAHKSIELLAGYLLGLLGTFLIVYYFTQYYS